MCIRHSLQPDFNALQWWAVVTWWHNCTHYISMHITVSNMAYILYFFTTALDTCYSCCGWLVYHSLEVQMHNDWPLGLQTWRAGNLGKMTFFDPYFPTLCPLHVPSSANSVLLKVFHYLLQRNQPEFVTAALWMSVAAIINLF